MARVLFAPETFNLGETSRAVEVARVLRERGHDVTFCGYSRRFAAHVNGAGFRLELLRPRLSEADADRLIALDQGRGVRHPFTLDMLRRRVRSERALIDTIRPEAVIIGSTMSQFVSARAAGVPLVYIKPYAMSRGHLTTMTDFPVVAGAGPVASMTNRLAGRAISTLAPRLSWLPRAFRVVAAENGVPLPRTTLEALEADLNLIASLPPAQRALPLGPRDEVVGPVFAHSTVDLPQSVRALAGGPLPLVHVGLGSSGSRALALRLVHEVARLDVGVVTGAGRYLSPSDRAGLPRNVTVTDHLPADRLTGLLAASVIHGGEGTVQTACASGAPFAGIGLQAEQRWNLEQCRLAGHAAVFTTGQLRRGRLPGILSRLLTDPDMASRAAQVRESMTGLDGATAAARAIERLVDGR